MTEATDNPTTETVKQYPQPLKDLGHIGLAVVGIALFGLGAALLVLLAILGLQAGFGLEWPWNGWTIVLGVGAGFAAMSLLLVPTIAVVRLIRRDIERTFSAWLADVSSLALGQNLIGVYIVVGIFHMS